ncbi:MAG: protein kinase, partial [Dehalococcoidia bacterium]
MPDPVERLNAALEGRYAIERELGEGGMATVYLAEDIKHNRKVALKVLKPELAAIVGAERFLTEIQVTANLQHPHILPLHDSGEADSFLFYVMPYVEGESLRERLDRENQLPVDEAVKIATDLAEALDYAHRNKVIHRDIKPANILMHEGRPLIADFGIALAVGAAGGARLTETGLSVGTPYYMSPEQATGDQMVGPQTDTYALGSVLYEMLVGEPPYLGNTAQAVLGKIIAGKPVSATEQRSSIPANVDAAVRCALEKLPADRFRSAQDFARALGDEHFRYGELATAGEGAAVSPWNRLTTTFAALAAVTTLGFGWSLLRPEPPAPVARFSSPFEEGQAPTGAIKFTADGSELVYVGPAESGEGQQLWIRRWAELDARPVRGTEGVGTFALSPDGREVAFTASPGPLRVVALDGGPSRTLVEVVATVDDWTSDGTVYFSEGATGGVGRLGRVPAAGGGSEVVEIITEVLEGELAHFLVNVLPGGRMAVFQVQRAINGVDAQVWAIDLETLERKFLTPGHTPHYAASEHLLFVTPDGVLMAAPINPRTAELTGPSVPVAEGLAILAPLGIAGYQVSASGALMYLAGGVATEGSGLLEAVWVTRSGDVVPVEPGWQFDATGVDFGLRLSPDGARLALSPVVDGNVDIRIKQLPDGPLERLT